MARDKITALAKEIGVDLVNGLIATLGVEGVKTMIKIHGIKKLAKIASKIAEGKEQAQEDKKLKKLIEDLSKYCHEKNYALMLCAGDAVKAIACNGTNLQVLQCIETFVNIMDEKSNLQFSDIVKIDHADFFANTFTKVIH